MIRLRCRSCGWVGWMEPIGGHLQNVVPITEWTLTPCPKCCGLYATYAQKVWRA